MKLPRKATQALWILATVILVVTFGIFITKQPHNTFADSDVDIAEITPSSAKYVTIYDEGAKLTVRTDATTVGEALSRANFTLNEGDRIDPSPDTEINADNFFINIYRARPVIIQDGVVEKYIMTASYDAKTIMAEAGITVYDGDEITSDINSNFLEAGVANVYTITRNGGRTITVEEEIPFTEEKVPDATLDNGKTEVRQLGEVGTKKITYNVLYKDNKEVSRKKVKEEVIRKPVKRVVAVGAKRSIPPEQATCADWARAAGVSEADLSAALQLIYHESGCRYDASNAGSGAYGIPQALPGSKMSSAGSDWATNPVTQIRWMSGYVSRYGGWGGALNFWSTHGWY